MSWGDEKKIDGGFWGKSYVERENYDGSKTVYEAGLFGKGKEVGKMTEGFWGNHTKVEADGGSTEVYHETFGGPRLHSSQGISAALAKAAQNAPKPTAVSPILPTLPLALPRVGNQSVGNQTGYVGSYSGSYKRGFRDRHPHWRIPLIPLCFSIAGSIGLIANSFPSNQRGVVVLELIGFYGATIILGKLCWRRRKA